MGGPIKHPAALLLALACAGCALQATHDARPSLQDRSRCEAPENRAGWCEWPRDVRRFVERYDACEHFRGEEPYDQERLAFLEKSMHDTCKGNDSALRRLRSTYANEAALSELLNENLQFSE